MSKFKFPSHQLFCNRGNVQDVRCSLSYIDEKKEKGNQYYIELLEQSLEGELYRQNRQSVKTMLKSKLKKIKQ